MSRIVPFSEARARLTELLDEVEGAHEHVVITRNGRPAAVILAEDEWSAVMESLEVLADDGAMEDLRASEADLRAGRVTEWESAKKKLGLA